MATTIKELDSITINKIAAGEVIDRPASIVKELVENAIDAGATTITIHIKEGGKELIKITDNGHGIHKEDLPLAPIRHATSKISSLDDIYNTDSFGFRGEALSSISHCASLTISSKRGDDSAYSITAFQDSISVPSLCSHPTGTTIEVHDLFHNIPVRKKFLKTSGTELSYIMDVCIHFSLIHPTLSFILIADSNEKLNTTGITDLESLLVSLYGKSLKDKLVPINESIGPISFSGFISDPTLTFPNKSKQVFAVNNRLIKNALIHSSLQRSYKDLIPHRRFPLAILNISIQSNQLDINIHPQKHDIKFINPGFLFDALPKAISISLQQVNAHTAPLEQLSAFSADSPPFPTQQSSPLPSSQSSPPLSSFSPLDSDPTSLRPYSVTEKSSLDTPYKSPDHYTPDTPTITEKTIENSIELFAQNSPQSGSSPLDFLQILKTYIILKTSDGAYIIDQHAVHERILYEQIKDNAGKDGSRQLLLLSEIISIDPDLMTIFESHNSFFEDLNFICESFGQDQIVVREIPIQFQRVSLQELIPSILLQLKEYPGSSRDLTLDQKEILQRKACRAAIKAGQTLHEAEIKQLLQDFIRSPQNFTCPHGRPLFFHFDQHKLETLFSRK
ncbi:DNA mismatch repair endonuclease MutL [Candidatus Marinamargulisbacteria bacterium SCGC AG-343-D04]|nr:DNA mismatch repair endonuclease MutL [Candidatus Marinamargulisbacteria bacterium SCGC AG-343-D04]